MKRFRKEKNIHMRKKKPHQQNNNKIMTFDSHIIHKKTIYVITHGKKKCVCLYSPS